MVFREIGLPQPAAVNEGRDGSSSAAVHNRGERKTRLSRVSAGAFDDLDETFFASVKVESGGFRAAANRYAEGNGLRRNAASGSE